MDIVNNSSPLKQVRISKGLIIGSIQRFGNQLMPEIKHFESLRNLKRYKKYSVFKNFVTKNKVCFLMQNDIIIKIILKKIKTQSHNGALSKIWVVRPRK